MPIDNGLIAQGIGLALAGIAVAYNLTKGKLKSTGSPPPERPPTPHEMREAVNGLHDHLHRITRNLDSLGSKGDTIIVEIRHIREGLREIESWQRLQDRLLNMRTPE